jgi:hypothetical protein
MIPLMSVEELEARLPANSLPLNGDGELDIPRITLALQDATGVIVAHLPWLLDDAGEVALPVPPRFADALDRLTDIVTGSENTRNKYKESLALLDKIDREYQGGLSGPDYQEAGIVAPSEDEGIDDSRYFKKEGPL